MRKVAFIVALRVINCGFEFQQHLHIHFTTTRSVTHEESISMMFLQYVTGPEKISLIHIKFDLTNFQTFKFNYSFSLTKYI